MSSTLPPATGAVGRSAGSLRALLVVLSLIPIGTGLWGIAVGPAGLPDPQVVNASVDSEYRFATLFWLAGGVALLWSTFRLRERRSVTRLVLTVASLGGFVRLWSVAMVGWPHPMFMATIVLELVVVPLVLWWHARAIPARDAELPAPNPRGGQSGMNQASAASAES